MFIDEILYKKLILIFFKWIFFKYYFLLRDGINVLGYWLDILYNFIFYCERFDFDIVLLFVLIIYLINYYI